MSRSRPRVDAHVAGLVLQVIGAFCLGAGLGPVLRLIDGPVGTLVPLTVGVASLRTLLGAVLSGLVTVAAFALWMRTVMSGMLTSQVSPRVLADTLDDGYQRSLLATMSGFLGLASTLLLALPDDGEVVSPVALPVLLAVTVTALAGILLALHRAVRDLSVPSLLTRQVVRGHQLLDSRAAHQDAQSRADIGAPAAPRRVVDVRCDRTGWVRAVDRDAMVRAVPDGTQLLLHVRAGTLVTTGDVLVSASEELDARTHRRLRAAVSTGEHRRPDDDISHIVEQVVDMATHALSPGSNDTATADEAMRAAGILLSALVRTGDPARHMAHGDSRLIDVALPGIREVVRTSVERLRMAATPYPWSARQFIVSAGTVLRAAEDQGRDDVVDDLREQGQRLLDSVADGDLAAADRADLDEAARSRGLCQA